MQANVFAFGIGSGIQYNELNSIASKPENVGQMQNFDQIEDFLRNDFWANFNLTLVGKFLSYES